MNISLQRLSAAAQVTGFNAEILEKVAQLLALLGKFQQHPYLKKKLVLKGGTALNLFYSDVQRLSVDVDLNYIGKEDRMAMLADRPKIDQAVQAVFAREGFSVKRIPDEHAGGKWRLRYLNAYGRTSNLEVDINFMCRVPLWPIAALDSTNVGGWQAIDIPILDFNELAAGKISALLARRKARDLFDSHWIMQSANLDPQRFRIAVIVYGAMNRKDWRTIHVEDIRFEARELVEQLFPTLRSGMLPDKKNAVDFGRDLVENCQRLLKPFLQWNEAERHFLDLLLDQGVIDPTILTTDIHLQDRIRRQPLLEWKAIHVRRYKGLT
ncbi:MAG: nucleotidyl transferase AbiEii/AbiGii toxin family protein [Candidatus Aminicenantes bacterium]|nr:nucleotidyl transferase AbiEii/AbiGii toxin family protein [Candidatus Aminicenantes bacterium]